MAMPVIVVADDRPIQCPRAHDATRVWSARPFNAESLIAMIDRMHGRS